MFGIFEVDVEFLGEGESGLHIQYGVGVETQLLRRLQQRMLIGHHFLFARRRFEKCPLARFEQKLFSDADWMRQGRGALYRTLYNRFKLLNSTHFQVERLRNIFAHLRKRGRELTGDFGDEPTQHVLYQFDAAFGMDDC